jgi:hypothetical protein
MGSDTTKPMPARSFAVYQVEDPEQHPNSTFYQIIRFFDINAKIEPYIVEEWQGWFGLRGTNEGPMMSPAATFQTGYDSEEQADLRLIEQVRKRMSEGFIYGYEFIGPTAKEPFTKIPRLKIS